MTAPIISIRDEALPDQAGWRKTAEVEYDLSGLTARTPFSKSLLEKLTNSIVVVFGAGSGGGRISLNLAKAGVGRFRLVDPDILELHNIPRHVASLFHLGRNKADAVAELMLLSNPAVCVEWYPLDGFHPNSPVSPQALFAGADLVIAATDRTSAQLQVNEWAWRLGVPAVFGGCYEAALGGEVLFTLPGAGTPCLACLRAGMPQPERRGTFDYSQASTEAEYHGEPGLNAAVDLVSDIETQIALGVLLRGSDSELGRLIHPQINFLLIGGALGTGYYRFRRPFHIFWQPLAGPRKDCPVCQG